MSSLTGWVLAHERTFGATSDKERLRLAESKMVGNGVAIVIYERASGEEEG